MIQAHNHADCVNNALAKARMVCDKNGVRLTPQRSRILEIVWNSHQPILAYEVLRILRQEKINAEPPTVYRALDFLLENCLIHKIESLNAYIGCNHADRQHVSQFLICTQCKEVTEVDSNIMGKAISDIAGQQQFTVEHQTIEISGLCHDCQNSTTETKNP